MAAAASATGRPITCSRAYQMVPVGITVEGANILTRTLITFAQGALRSHPYLFTEIQALQDADRERGLDAVRARLRPATWRSRSPTPPARLFHNVTFGVFGLVAAECRRDTADW